MEMVGNTVLITGGSAGIGLALAERFLKAGNEVIICGRREEKLNEAKEKNPGFHTRVCDVANSAERLNFSKWIRDTFPKINVLINNAGIQRRLKLTEPEAWDKIKPEVAINFDAPIHLSMLFIPLIIKQSSPVIINISSGLAFKPLADVPVYSATKAGIHSFTQSLRTQLADSPIKVIEIMPPAVDTDLGGPGLHSFGVNLDKFADSVFSDLKKGVLEINYPLGT
jgi:uncharacterized oxidoreductase